MPVATIFLIQSWKGIMSKRTFKLKPIAIAIALSNMSVLSVNADERVIEKIVVTAEKRG